MKDLIFLLFSVSILGIVIFIQVKLSRRENKFLGLIMPILSFLFSLMIVFGFRTFSGITTLINEIMQSVNQIESYIDYLSVFFILLVSNIPTITLAGIYINERNKIGLKKSIEKMKIEDL